VNTANVKRIIILLAAQLLLPVMAMAEAAEEHHGNPAPGIGLVWSFLNFFVLIGILVYFTRKPLLEFFQTRASQTKNQAEAAGKLYEDARRQFDEIDRKLKNAQQEGQQLIAGLKADGEEEKQRLIANAKALSDQLVIDTKRIVEQEGKRAQETLKTEAVRLATELAANQVKAQIKPEDETRFGAEFLSLLKKAGQS
jgi:F-type H+-transporting ATPase subunit b